MSIFVKIPGVQGNATAKGYEKDIALTSVAFAGMRETGVQSGRTRRDPGDPQLKEVILTKLSDPSSHIFFQNFLQASCVPRMEIFFCSTGSTPALYKKYVLKNVLVSNYASNDQAGVSVETIYISYSSIELTSIPRDATNTSGAQRVTAYNLETGLVS